MICPQLGHWGAEKSFIRLANFLDRHHDVQVAVFAGDYGEAFRQEPTEPLLAPVTLLPGAGRGRIGRWLSRWWALRALKREHDVAISFLSGPNLLNVVSASKIPAIISVRGSRRYDKEGSDLWRFLWNHILDRVAYDRAETIVTASIGLAGEVQDVCGASDQDKVVPIEGSINAADLVRFADAPVDPEFERLAGLPTIVACGRLHEQKGFQHLIPIFARVIAARTDAKLLIVGDGPELASLMALSAAHGLRPTCDVGDTDNADVIFAGYRDHPARYFKLGRVFAFPSLYEGLPNALIEAVAAGIPILAADCPWGPRSVLSGHPTELSLSPDEHLPIDLPFGTLMPRLDGDQAHTVWSERLIAALRAPCERSLAPERNAAISRFDLDRTGHAWLAAVDKATARAA